MPRTRTHIWLACLAWAGLIFLTSSTIVTPHQLFDWLQAHVFRSEAAIDRFQVFWGAVWLFVVKGWHVLEFAVLMLLATKSLDAWLHRQNRINVLLAAQSSARSTRRWPNGTRPMCPTEVVWSRT